MECKDVFIRLVGTKLSVLIETLWNVKSGFEEEYASDKLY